jgi:SAM-dependent methyltransferase
MRRSPAGQPIQARVRGAVAALGLALFAASPAWPQPAPQEPATQRALSEVKDGAFVGDVPYVATPQDVVDRMLDLARVGPGDYLIDLGSGDGRLVVTAAKRGAEGFGVDLDPERVAEATDNAKRAGVADRAQFFQRDLFETDFSRATVLTLYLLPDINLRLRPKVLALTPGTRVVSHDFDMGDWTPDERVQVRSAITHHESDAYLWIVPAAAGGRWRTDGADGIRFTVVQRYQEITVTASGPQGALDVGGARLSGAHIAFRAGPSGLLGRSYEGRIDGDVINGIMRDAAGEWPWSARRDIQK